jgi:cytidylate kinase
MSSYRVLTIGREYGCGSGEIARRLAERLGWKLYDRELIDEIARAAHLDPGECQRADERVDTWMRRLGRGLWNVTGERGPATIPEVALDADTMAALARQVIESLAAVGECVIVGRGGNYILSDRHDTFHVFFYAPRHWRVARLQALGHAPADAEGAVERIDHERAAYIRHYFDQDWPRRQLYHLMANASLGPDAAVAATLAALKRA